MSKAELVPFPLGPFWLGDPEQVTALWVFVSSTVAHYAPGVVLRIRLNRPCRCSANAWHLDYINNS